MSEKLSKEFGTHYLVEYINCDSDNLKGVAQVKEGLLKAAELSGATIIQQYFHQFEPQGVTGILLIAESHFSIHTWPEDQFVAFDILTCGQMDAQKAIDYLKDFFGAKEQNVKVISRGY